MAIDYEIQKIDQFVYGTADEVRLIRCMPKASE